MNLRLELERSAADLHEKIFSKSSMEESVNTSLLTPKKKINLYLKLTNEEVQDILISRWAVTKSDIRRATELMRT